MSDAEPDVTGHEVRPVDQQRLLDWMKGSGQRYFVGGDGTLGGLWNGCVFTFMIVGQGTVLQIRGQWNRPVSIDRRHELIEVLNDRHGRTVRPKCLLLVLDDGSMRVAADVSLTIVHGLSDAQLDRGMRMGVAAGLSVFAELGARYPDPLSIPPENLA